MIQFEVLRPNPEFGLTIETSDGTGEDNGLELPFVVPFHFAEHCEAGDFMIWHDAETNVTGLFHPKTRVSWRKGMIRLANIAVLHPRGTNEGVVGLEIGFADEEEAPVLAADCYSREALDWFKAHRETWKSFFGVTVSVADYGLDR